MTSSRLMRLPRWSRPAAVVGWNLLTRSALRSRLTVPQGPLYCKALAGESDYNVCINSDVTVSCNCRDFDGSGRIGDLRHQSLEEIFSGSVVASFQAALYRGRLPVSTCPICPELSVLPSDRAIEGPAKGRVPTLGIMVENTACCNLACQLCDRQRLLAERRQSSLTLEDVERVARMLAHHGVERVCYFNLGEPFVSRTILDELLIMRTHLPDARIITSTNGVLLDRDDALAAALMMDYVFVSIDGVDQQTLDRYQRGGDFSRSLENMSRLVCTREVQGHTSAEGVFLPIVEWKYVLFRWNDRPGHIRQAIQLAQEAGVDRLTFVPGEAPVRDMSLRYFTDRSLLEEGLRTEAGVSFDFTEIPEHLR